jgi:hypothetical protein
VRRARGAEDAGTDADEREEDKDASEEAKQLRRDAEFIDDERDGAEGIPGADDDFDEDVRDNVEEAVAGKS